jgi:hypothetical protein
MNVCWFLIMIFLLWICWILYESSKVSWILYHYLCSRIRSASSNECTSNSWRETFVSLFVSKQNCMNFYAPKLVSLDSCWKKSQCRRAILQSGLNESHCRYICNWFWQIGVGAEPLKKISGQVFLAPSQISLPLNCTTSASSSLA